MADELDPAEALALAKGARDRVAARAGTPAWYAPLYGLCCGGLVAGAGMKQPLGLAIIGVSLAAVLLLYRTWQQQSGLSVSGYRKGRTRTIALALAALLVMLALGGFELSTRFGILWAPYACGAAAALTGALASLAWDRAWLAELAGDVE
ncbi:MAG: hypothetical protein QOD42_171 [Sphingomonadales bacterium]|nr:hypothetical protein [Sphingomonadales bacterium]